MAPAYTHVIVLALSERCLLVYLTVEMPSPPEPLITPPAPQTYSSQNAEEPDLRGKIRERDRQLNILASRLRNGSGQGHSTVKIPVCKGDGRSAQLLIYTDTPI
jgi:hypothetical protein